MIGNPKKVSGILHFGLLIFLIIFVSSCGDAFHSSSSSETGSITFSVEWPGAPQESSGRYATTLDCAGAGVSTVEASVYDENDSYLVGGGPWNCSAHSGTITGVPVGSNRKVVILGKDSSGNDVYSGEGTGITVQVNQTPTVYIIVLPTTPDDDHGDTYYTATSISTDGTLYSGSIETGGDVDYFSFFATSGYTYVIETSDLGFGSDTYIYLYSTNGTTEIDHDDDGGADAASRMELAATSSGTYYIKVRHFNSSSGIGTYKISVTSSGTSFEGFESGNFNNMAWYTGGHGYWQVTSDYAYNGLYAAKAPVSIVFSQSSYLQITLVVYSAGDISFWYKVSSESNCDFLVFKIDGIQQYAWSGELGWTQAAFSVSSGTRTFRWLYTKDGSLDMGDDTAWIDDIVFPY
jgi:hypothetical protein